MMMPAVPGTVWQPSPQRCERAVISRYRRRLADHDLRFADYHELWQLAVDDPEGFWGAVDEFFELPTSAPVRGVLGQPEMPGADWFQGASKLHRRISRGQDDPATAVLHMSELRDTGERTWRHPRRETAQVRSGLDALGVGSDHRVAADAPTVPETIAALLATPPRWEPSGRARPDFRARTVIDRFSRLEAVHDRLDGRGRLHRRVARTDV